MTSNLDRFMKKILLPLLLALFLPLAVQAQTPAGIDNAALQQLLAKNRGKVVMLNFFATWCPPCRAEIPEIVKMRNAFPEAKLLVIGLSVDEKNAPVTSFMEKTGINYPVYMADRSVTDAYGISSVPHNAFYAPDGKLIISEPGMASAEVLDQVVSDLSR